MQLDQQIKEIVGKWGPYEANGWGQRFCKYCDTFASTCKWQIPGLIVGIQYVKFSFGKLYDKSLFYKLCVISIIIFHFH